VPKGSSSSHQQAQTGSIVRKLFKGHGTFEGVLEGFDPVDCKYRVEYEDGDAEDASWEELEPHIVQPAPPEYKAGDECSFEINPDTYKGMKQVYLPSSFLPSIRFCYAPPPFRLSCSFLPLHTSLSSSFAHLP